METASWTLKKSKELLGANNPKSISGKQQSATLSAMVKSASNGSLKPVSSPIKIEGAKTIVNVDIHDHKVHAVTTGTGGVARTIVNNNRGSFQ